MHDDDGKGQSQGETRRDFLKKTGLVAGGTILAPGRPGR
jgi:hypothetical protein